MNTCPKCGNTTEEGKSFCSACGERLTPPPPVGMPVPPPSAPRISQQAPAQTTNGLAIASLVLGILGLGLVGLILGIIALVQIGKDQGRGRGLAIGGIVCSIFIPLLVLPAILYPVFAKAREEARQTTCLSNQRQIALSIQMYCQETNETLPDSLAQVQSFSSLPEKNIHCPSATTPISYGYNQALARQPLRMINAPATTMLTADSAKQFMTSPSDIDVTRHRRGYIASFVDAHVAYKSN